MGQQAMGNLLPCFPSAGIIGGHYTWLLVQVLGLDAGPHTGEANPLLPELSKRSQVLYPAYNGKAGTVPCLLYTCQPAMLLSTLR